VHGQFIGDFIIGIFVYSYGGNTEAKETGIITCKIFFYRGKIIKI